ncbi:hypothetical protein MTO96_018188, partial [Rhipicephalus appendiculatus]
MCAEAAAAGEAAARLLRAWVFAGRGAFSFFLLFESVLTALSLLVFFAVHVKYVGGFPGWPLRGLCG